MKIVVALDSFKDCLSSMEAGKAVKEGILTAIPEAEVVIKPLADGGEGTTTALITAMQGEKRALTVTGPLGALVNCFYGYHPEKKVAIMEMAAAAGIELIPADQRNPWNTTTYGVGEIIRNAIKNGARKLIVGIGGSATNDCGIGMLQALGYEFLDVNGNPVGRGGGELGKIASIDSRGAMRELKECSFEIACDVTNPLCGTKGASAVYGPQKGASITMVQQLDDACCHFADIVMREQGNDYRNYPGAGAAGGLGFAFLSFLNARLRLGIEIVMEQLNVEQELKNADYLITGEGKLDTQTAMGKAPVGIASLAKRHGVTVIALAGSLEADAKRCNDYGMDAIFSITNAPISLQQAIHPQTATQNLKNTTEQIFRLIKTISK